MKIRPLQGEVLLYIETPPTVSDGGIALIEESPDQNRPETATFGQVRALGIWRLDAAGRMLAHPVRTGDRVLINSGAGRWLRSESERMKLVHESQLLAIVEKKVDTE